MRAARIGLAIALAVTAQSTYALFATGTTVNVDFPLVAVVCAALSGGPIVGLWAGTVAGLAQDLLSGGLVGVSGLAKSLVGFAVGAVGARFLVTVWHRALILVAATVVHACCFVGVYALIPLAGPVLLMTDVLGQGVANAVTGLVAVGVVGQAPLGWERMFRRRQRFAARRWRAS